MTPQELKASILQQAIQGKLVDQRPEDGTGEKLFQQIQAEKQALVKAGKIKKGKALSPITDDDILFDIPTSWKWTRLGELVRVIGGVSYNKNDVCKQGIRILRGGNIQNMQVLLDEDDVFLPQEYYEEEKQVQPCDILIVASTGSKTIIGKAGHVDRPVPNAMIGAFLRICRPIDDDLSGYLKVIFDSDFYRKHIRELAQGTNINNVKESYITEFAVPLPPLAEQKRIAAKLEDILPLIDRYEAAWNKLEEFNKRFPGDMQKAILQMAIQGKLVEQRPEEGTGEELFQQIQTEKQALIKAGVIKKEKPLPKITAEEIPFDIPDTWRWVQLGDLCSVVTGRLDANAQKPDGNYAFFTCGREVFKTDTYAFDCDAILLGGNNASGDYKMHRYAGKFNAYQRVYVISGAAKDTLDFLYHVVTYWLGHLKHNSQGTTTRFIKLGQVTGMLIPFPPLEEQKRIVAKLEEILPLCDRLK